MRRHSRADRRSRSLILVREGPNGPVRLGDYDEPCAARSRLLVVRSAPAWCGSCGWHAAHTTRLLGDPRLDRLRLLDLLIADENNMPPTSAAAVRWRTRIDVPPSLDSKIEVDATYMFSAVLPAKNVLPEYVLIERAPQPARRHDRRARSLASHASKLDASAGLYRWRASASHVRNRPPTERSASSGKSAQAAVSTAPAERCPDAPSRTLVGTFDVDARHDRSGVWH